MPKRVSLKGRGADLFFGDDPTNTEPTTDVDSASPVAQLLDSESISRQEPAAPDTAASEAIGQREENKPTTRRKSPRPSSNTNGAGHTSTAALVPVDANAVEAIRQVLKIPGREVSYVRLTPEEKARLSDIVYTYKRQGQKTSETEINRIALNYLLLDYHEHGEQSVLARVLAALLA
jgi:hypothetical protein